MRDTKTRASRRCSRSRPDDGRTSSGGPTSRRPLPLSVALSRYRGALARTPGQLSVAPSRARTRWGHRQTVRWLARVSSSPTSGHAAAATPQDTPPPEQGPPPTKRTAGQLTRTSSNPGRTRPNTLALQPELPIRDHHPPANSAAAAVLRRRLARSMKPIARRASSSCPLFGAVADPLVLVRRPECQTPSLSLAIPLTPPTTELAAPPHPHQPPKRAIRGVASALQPVRLLMHYYSEAVLVSFYDFICLVWANNSPRISFRPNPPIRALTRLTRSLACNAMHFCHWARL